MVSAARPYLSTSILRRRGGVSGGSSGVGVRTPFGRPVVPDEYNIEGPRCRPTNAIAGSRDMSSSYDRNGVAWPSTIKQCSSVRLRRATGTATAASAAEETYSLASEFCTIYAASSILDWLLTHA